ncbi:MAG: hypothetical protein ACKODX_10125 [Gemmata sp.]
MRANGFDLFLWIKLYTIVFCACYGTMRYTRLIKPPRVSAAITALLATNILEAVALDLVSGGAAHALNATAGRALVVAPPWGRTGRG